MYILKKSDKSNKKYKVVFQEKTLYFGDSSYEDYTTHKDIERKKNI